MSCFREKLSHGAYQLIWKRTFIIAMFSLSSKSFALGQICAYYHTMLLLIGKSYVQLSYYIMKLGVLVACGSGYESVMGSVNWRCCKKSHLYHIMRMFDSLLLKLLIAFHFMIIQIV